MPHEPVNGASEAASDSRLRDLVSACYQRVDANDVDGLVALFEPDAKYDRPGTAQIVGRTALKRFYRTQEPVRSREHVLTKILWRGRDVAVHGRAERVGLDGRHTTIHFADFFTISAAGLFSYRRTFFFVPFA